MRELYANAKSIDDAPMVKVSWVRGQQVSFYRDVIHVYIEDNHMAHFIRLDPFVVHLVKGNLDCDEIAVNTCEAGKTNQLGRDGLLIHFKDLT